MCVCVCVCVFVCFFFCFFVFFVVVFFYILAIRFHSELLYWNFQTLYLIKDGIVLRSFINISNKH